MHVCNPWCFDGVHALLFDSTLTDQAAVDRVGQALAAREGFRWLGVGEVRPPGTPAPGTPTKNGIARGRMVIWAAAAVVPTSGRVAS